MSLRQEGVRTYILSNYILNPSVTLERLRAEYPNLIFNSIAPQVFTIEVPENYEVEFAPLQEVAEVPTLYGLNALQALQVSNILGFHDNPELELRGTGVIVGFVDTGIDYNNNLFKNADNTTRILGIWDQTIEGSPPEDYNYGTLYNAEEINEALRAEDPFLIVPTRDEDGHGTFLAGITAGNDQTGTSDYVGGAPDAQILVVKLRPAKEDLREYNIIEPDVPAYQENDIIAGINFLIDEALLRFEKPIAICVGIGSNYGAHNGTEILERYIEDIGASRNTIITVAVGNEGNTSHHYLGEITDGGSQDIEINVPEGSVGFRLQLWTTLPDKVAISVKSPLGQVIEKIPVLLNQIQTYRFNLEATVLSIQYDYPDIRTGGESIEVALRRPTPGIWTLTVYGEDIVNGTYNAWLPRRGFVKDNTRFLRPNPEITVQNPGTGQYTFVVGAYDYVDDSIYVASGRGPTTDGIIKPDIVAPGVNIEGPVPGGGYTIYTGTSTAAAITTSASALLLQWAIVDGNFPHMNTRIARAIFMRGARRQRNVSYPNNIEGYGRLDLRTSIANI